MNQQINQFNDPWDNAEHPQLPPETMRFWGQLTVEAWFCVLEKGIGKKPFDPTLHAASDRRTAIRVTVTTLPEHKLKNPDVYREYIAEEWGKIKPWNQITLPSFRELGLESRTATGKWVCIELVPEGRTFVSALTGETKESTTIRLAAVYPDEAACRAAFYAERGQEPTASQPTSPQFNNNGNNGGAHLNPEQAVAYKFLQVLVRNANGDLNKLAQQIAGNPVLAKYYTIESPEVLQLLQEGQA